MSLRFGAVLTLGLIFTACSSPPVDPPSGTVAQRLGSGPIKLEPSSVDADRFGNALAISASTAVAGAVDTMGPNDTHPGALYIFDRGADGWKETGRFSSEDGDDYLGEQVATDGETVCARAGQSVYVYERRGGAWTKTARLHEETYHGHYGIGLAVSGDTILVGAPLADGGGKVFVYRRSGDSWAFETTIAPKVPDPTTEFGRSLFFEGDDAVIGASSTETGAAYVFHRAGATWNEEVKLAPKDPTGIVNFGHNLARSGDKLVVTAVRRTAGASTFDVDGRVFIFSGSGATWTEEAILESPSLTNALLFGRGVGFSQGALLVGEEDRVAVFEPSGGTWTERAAITPPELSLFGAMAVGGGHLLVSDFASSRLPGVHEYPPPSRGTAWLYEAPADGAPATNGENAANAASGGSAPGDASESDGGDADGGCSVRPSRRASSSQTLAPLAAATLLLRRRSTPSRRSERKRLAAPAPK